MAKTDSPSTALVPTDLWPGTEDAPQMIDVLTQLAHFLEQIGYTKTVAALQKEAAKYDITIDSSEWTKAIDSKTGVPLLELYELWQKKKKSFPTLPAVSSDDSSESEDESEESDDESMEDAVEGALVDAEAEETSDDDSDEKSESDSDGSSEDEDDEVEQKDVEIAVSDKKRKRSPTPSSSDESSSNGNDSDSSSDEAPAPRAKKAKVKASSGSSSSDSSSSSSGSTSSDSESDSDSDSSSSGSSSSGSSSSDSSSDSSSESSSESEADVPAPVKEKKSKKEKKDKIGKEAEAPAKAAAVTPAKEGSTASSATLEGEEETQNAQESHIHPSRLRQVPSSDPKPAGGSAKKQTGKKEIVPFSRIPADQKVDPRFASNAYVSYDYADRAHQDLIVTKGKGFTKEKNKKKRGAYRGGAIDLTPKGIKFDD